MTDIQIAMALSFLAGAVLVGALHFIADIRHAPVIETLSPYTYQAVTEITAERARQVESEGFTALKDDQYVRGELVWAAVSYAGYAGDPRDRYTPAEWPWASRWWKPETPRRALVKAAALIVAEVERIDRAEARKAAALTAKEG